MSTYWPQALMALFLLLTTIGSMVMHGKPMRDPVVNYKSVLMAMLWIALVLGAGGFWRL